MKKILQSVILILIILVTLLGMKVLVVGGGIQERLMTLALVALIYLVLFQLFRSISNY